MVKGVETELDVAGRGLLGHLAGHVAKPDVLEIRDRGIPPNELALSASVNAMLKPYRVSRYSLASRSPLNEYIFSRHDM
jgi:hypothetical protein